MSARALCLLGVVLGWSVGCGGGHHGSAPSTVSTDDDGGASVIHECEDADGDGFGRYCTAGADCDDSDPGVTDECKRCIQPSLNCPCEPGTAPMRCDPHYAKKVSGGMLICSEGTRYCRDGAYSDCEVLQQYVMFVSD